MAFALIGIGLLLFMAAYHNNVAMLGSQLSADVSGASGFFIWVVALFLIGALGYVPVLKGVSRIFLVLILVVVFLANKGFFQQFTAALGVASSKSEDSGPTAPDAPTAPTAPTGATP
jgi:hypothetical protein